MQKMNVFSRKTSGDVYTIHNAHVPLFDVRIDSNTSRVEYVTKVHGGSPSHSFPLLFNEEDPDTSMVMDWFNGRHVALSRKGYENVSRILAGTVGSLDLRVGGNSLLGMQLTDQYWAKPLESSANYDHVSLFGQDLGSSLEAETLGFWIGNNVSQWYIKRYASYLMHNEFFTVKLAEIIGDNVVDEPFVVEYEKIAGNTTKCKNFVKENEEFIPAIQLLWRPGAVDGNNLYKCLIEVGSSLIQGDYRKFVDLMIIIDYLVGNTDRDLKNFGYLRECNTGKVRPAPLYNGVESMLSNISVLHEWNGQVPSKPFRSVQDQQVALADVRPFLTNLEAALEILPELYEQCYEKVLDSYRYDFVLRFVTDNIKRLLMR